MKLHLFKLSYWRMSQNHFLVGDIDAIGGQGNQWWCAARLLGLPLDRFLALHSESVRIVALDYLHSITYHLQSAKDRSHTILGRMAVTGV